MEKPADQQFLEALIRAMVDYPESVIVTRKIDERGVLLSLKVNSQDMGQIIGRKGNTAKSIRALLKIVGMKNDARVNLKIEEPEGGIRAAETNLETAAPEENV
jgi:hypothetical protein